MPLNFGIWCMWLFVFFIRHQRKVKYPGIFLYFFYHKFAKIYDPSEILQNYTSSAVAYDVRDITLWPTAVGAASSGLVALPPWAMPLSL
jgi:hypothetical protein